MPAFRFDEAGFFATRVHRPDGSLTLVSIRPDGTIAELDDVEGFPGAHPRERPEPTVSRPG
jgi:hypothetical protein